jgi:hypothetical protein
MKALLSSLAQLTACVHFPHASDRSMWHFRMFGNLCQLPTAVARSVEATMARQDAVRMAVIPVMPIEAV